MGLGRCGSAAMWGRGDVGLGEAAMTAPKELGNESCEAQLQMGDGQPSCAAWMPAPHPPRCPRML